MTFNKATKMLIYGVMIYNKNMTSLDGKHECATFLGWQLALRSVAGGKVRWLCNKGGLLLAVVAKICFVLLELIRLSPTGLNGSQTSFQSQEPCMLPEH